MTEITLTLPAEAPVELHFLQNRLPGWLTVNAALRDAALKPVFRWHLSVRVANPRPQLDRLPSAAEQALLRVLETSLHRAVSAKGNALFAARVTHDGAREIVWRVHDARVAYAQLQALAADPTPVRDYSFRLDDDPQWELMKEHLDQGS